MLQSELIIESIIEAYIQVDAELRIRFMNAKRRAVNPENPRRSNRQDVCRGRSRR